MRRPRYEAGGQARGLPLLLLRHHIRCRRSGGFTPPLHYDGIAVSFPGRVAA